MRISGKVWIVGNNVDTDMLYPARFMNTSDIYEMAKHCMEDYDQEFIRKIQKGDIIVAGDNFGCGSSREHAPISIKAAGISCIIAKSFARIFYRNAINIGLPIFECKEAVVDAIELDNFMVDFSKGEIVNKRLNKSYKVQAFPGFMQQIIMFGGLIEQIDALSE